MLQVRGCSYFLGGVYNVYDNTVYYPQGSRSDEGYSLTRGNVIGFSWRRTLWIKY